MKTFWIPLFVVWVVAVSGWIWYFRPFSEEKRHTEQKREPTSATITGTSSGTCVSDGVSTVATVVQPRMYAEVDTTEPCTAYTMFLSQPTTVRPYNEVWFCRPIHEDWKQKQGVWIKIQVR